MSPSGPAGFFATLPVRAYAVLDGGGVKGAALAGCLRAASERGITFNGYGGTSAGSIIAMLAAIGFEPREIKQLVLDTAFAQTYLPDNGARLSLALRNLRSFGPLVADLATGDGILAWMRRAKSLY